MILKQCFKSAAKASFTKNCTNNYINLKSVYWRVHMRIRGLKQVFHWIFLVVGIFSLIMLGITVNTYISYAEEGYGLDMYFDQASLNENRLVLRFYFENPGSLDIEIRGGNVTLGDTYTIPYSAMPGGILSDLPGRDNTSVVIWVPISDPDLGNVQMDHKAEITVQLNLWIPERYLETTISYQAEVGVSV